MSSPVPTVEPKATLLEARTALLQDQGAALFVVGTDRQFVGTITRQDVDLAIHYGFEYARVENHMMASTRAIAPTASLAEVEALMDRAGLDCLPVVKAGQVIGVITADTLRQRRQPAVTAEVALQTPPQAPPEPETLQAALQRQLAPELWDILQAMATVAAARDWQLYLVGGAVRDLFLTPDGPLALQDVDLLVDGAAPSSEIGAGVVLAEAIQQRHPGAELQVYGQFQTAALKWPEGLSPAREPLMMDIATARTELYPYPAANPIVSPGSVRQDLHRRDFTVNALAICLTQSGRGDLLDLFGGLDDLRQSYIRVLHANSFIEDPTRIYRAVRFAIRLGFTLEPRTEALIRYATRSGLYPRLLANGAKVPALQARLKAELQYILEAPYWEPALVLLHDLGALVCLHPALRVDVALRQRLRRLSRWLQHFQGLANLNPGRLRLELLLAAVPPEARRPVAETLRLPESSVLRLAQLATVEAHILAECPCCDRPSQWVKLLCPHDTETLLLLGARRPQELGRWLWSYLLRWSQVTPCLSGADLKAMGYTPGPQFREMLDALRWAALDGEISSREAAQALIQQKYPDPPLSEMNPKAETV